MKFKFLAFVLCLLLMVSGLAACNTSKDKDHETDPPAEPGSVEIALIYPLNATDTTVSLAYKLAASIENATEHTVQVNYDYLKNGQTADANATEIYFGVVDRTESQSFMGELPPCGYGWSVSGNKLMISAMTEAELDTVVKLFVENALPQIADTLKPFAEVKRTVYTPEYISLVGNGQAIATLSADESDAEAYKAAQSLQKLIKQLTGMELQLKSGSDGDVVIKTEGLGNTDGYNGYGIRFSNGEISLASINEEGRKSALSALSQMISQYYANGNQSLNIPKDRVVRWTLDSKYPLLPFYSENSQIYQSDSNYMVYVEKSDADALAAYAEKLIADGYQQQSRTERNGNIYYTLTNDKYMAYLYYTNYNKSVRLIGAPISQYNNMTALQNANTSNGNVKFSQLNIGNTYGSDGNLNNNGMSYAFQLSDGSFILIDGGNPTNDSDVDVLYNWLRNQTGEGNTIRISAWLISHLHWDHVGVYCKFMEKYGQEVKVNALVTNFPSFSYFASIPDSDLSYSWHKQNYADFENVMKTSFLSNQIITPHTGQSFSVGNAKIEILYTHEDLYPTPLTLFNNSSTVYRITIGEKTWLFGGDLQEAGSLICVNINGSLMESDYVQVTHHGYNGATSIYYQTADGKTLLIPNGQKTWSPLLRYPVSAWLSGKYSMANSIFAGNGIYTVEIKVN